MIHKLRQGAKAYAWHWSLIALVVGLLWAGIGFNLWHDHEIAVQGAVKDTTNLARTFAEDITRTVEAVDQTLLFAREAYRLDPTASVLDSWARARAFLDDLHVQIAVANRDGTVVWSNLGSVTTEINIADRAHFRAQKGSVEDNLLIGRPVLGRVSGKWTIQFTRKLLAQDGSFDGVVVVSLDPVYLSRFYESVSIGDGSVLLATIDGVVLAHAPDRVRLTGSDLPADTKARLLRGTTAGAYRAVSSLDQVDRIFYSRRLDRYPLVLAVGLAAADVFAPYEWNKRVYVAVGILLTVISVIVGLIMIRQRQSLLDSRQALSVTLENMSQGIAMVGGDGKLPVLNQRAISLLELPTALLERRPTYQEIIDWQYANHEFGKQRTRVSPSGGGAPLRHKPRSDYTYERTRPNGTVLEVRTLGLPDGGFVRTFTDITQRRLNEAALIAAQTRAAHAERMQALGQLAGGIAHDFNNILQAVQGGAALIDRRADDADSVQRFAKMILDATERGTSITRRLLAFARRGELRAEPVEPETLLSGLRDVLIHTLGSGITVEVHNGVGLPPLLADQGQLETALVNLATNARDAMPDGGTLTFATSVEKVGVQTKHPAELRPGQYVRLSITDTGTGIDAATLARVLEPFFSTKPSGKGTGLGLSMAKGFVEQSGGGLTIDSHPGRGTIVNLWLPTATRQPVLPEAPLQTAPKRNGSLNRILLVDDDAMVRETLAASLRDAGYIVSIAESGASALELLRSPAEVGVLVTDLSMPGIDGLAVIKQAQAERTGLPAVLLTGYAGHGAQLAIGESVSGPFSLMRKPVTAAQLADRIETLLAVAVVE